MNGIAGYAGSIVNPALALAIESTRQHLRATVSGAVAIDSAGLPNWPGTRLPAKVDDAAQLLHWHPDCRAGVLAFEALSGLSFRATQAGAGSAPGGELLTWGVRTDGKPDPVTLIVITRPGLDVLKQQAQRVAERMPERLMPKSDDLANRERLAEIAVQVAPPLAFWCAVLPLHPDRMPRTMELIDLMLLMSSFAVQRFKHALAVSRPHQVDARIFPAILTPAHASLPSGHATEAYAIASLLAALLGPPAGAPGVDLERRLFLLAARIADNREVAGLHYPIDTQAGRLLGTVLADYLVARCTGLACHSAAFNGHAMQAADPAAPQLEPRDGAAYPIRPSDTLAWLWQRARLEWGADEQAK